MIKKIVVVFLVCSLDAAAFSVHALAINQQAEEAILEETLMIMEHASENMDKSGDLAFISSKTGQLTYALLQSLQNGDTQSLQPSIEDCAAALELIKAQQLVEECRDALLFGLYYSGWSLLQTLSGGGDQVCTALSAGSTIADILIVLQSYQLCAIDNSEVPDETLRETICQQQKLVKTYDFIAGWAYSTRCTYDVSFATYLTLIVNFLTVFSVCA